MEKTVNVVVDQPVVQATIVMDDLVEIQEVQTGIAPVYVIKIAGINLRAYLSKDDTDRIAGFMKNVVESIITTGKGVEVQELQNDVLPIYLLKIGGINSRAYLSKAEMTRTVNYITTIVNAVKARGSQT